MAAGEPRDGWMHAVLNLQHVHVDARVDQALEQGRSQAFPGGRVGRDRGRQLAVVPKEHELLAAVAEWHDCGQLRGLRCLVDQHPLEAVPLDDGAAGADGGGRHDLSALDHIVDGIVRPPLVREILQPSDAERLACNLVRAAVQQLGPRRLGPAQTYDVYVPSAHALDDVVDGDVRVGGGEDAAADHTRTAAAPVVEDSHCDRGLACARRPLDQHQGSASCSLHGPDLAVIHALRRGRVRERGHGCTSSIGSLARTRAAGDHSLDDGRRGPHFKLPLGGLLARNGLRSGSREHVEGTNDARVLLPVRQLVDAELPRFLRHKPRGHTTRKLDNQGPIVDNLSFNHLRTPLPIAIGAHADAIAFLKTSALHVGCALHSVDREFARLGSRIEAHGENSQTRLDSPLGRLVADLIDGRRGLAKEFKHGLPSLRCEVGAVLVAQPGRHARCHLGELCAIHGVHVHGHSEKSIAQIRLCQCRTSFHCCRRQGPHQFANPPLLRGGVEHGSQGAAGASGVPA
mmetsp:Transcript_32139/g.90324  ORF Transcript_32139/g.90324 Transcript_32139/m.90324 type:complete len:515 (+) Transcript_32139:1013-2557(+)